eukprot:TRINITY_DN5061_c0_g1_i2.p1 TRINITY_DN5061_c0_g1~~TRINITY_DN5061_c0_g1_i2.p1  ORF type:complete len:658 (+),score=164.43 TRINITY_DN5061_c0_g1_i2:63-2036(+)
MAELDAIDLSVLTVIAGGIVYLAINYFCQAKSSNKGHNIQVAAPVSSGAADDDFVAKMKEVGAQLIVFFGSQTGTAEDYAQRLAGEARRYGLKAIVADLQDYDMDQLEQLEDAVALFCVATYGEGEPTDNAQDFHESVKSKQDMDMEWDLKGLDYGVFGLGNKTYEHFNSMAIFVDKALDHFGAKRIIDVGLGDDDENLEEDFITWKDALWPALCERFGKDPNAIGVSYRTYESVPPEEVNKGRMFTGEQAIYNSYVTQRKPFSQKNPYLAPVKVRRELYHDESRSCLHLELDIAKSGIRYTAGDHVAVFPANNPRLVQRIAQRLNLDLSAVVCLRAVDSFTKKKTPFPCPCTYETALTHYVELTHLPSATLMAELPQYASHEKEKARLTHLVSKEGRKEYHDYIAASSRTLMDVLTDFPSVMIPGDHLMELLPRMQPRYYSISSSSKQHPDAIHITAAVVRYNNKVNTEVEGVATTWFERLDTTNMKLPIFVRRSTFRLPNKPTVPIIMIGPGTGVAPFRGFIQERTHVAQAGKTPGPAMLFFGCQNEAKHFMYRDELQAAKEAGVLSHLHTAFSRDQAAKVYVQHRLREAKQEVWELLDKGAYIYICGDAKHMARDVQQALLDIIKEMGDKSTANAESYIKMLEDKRRFQKDVWS